MMSLQLLRFLCLVTTFFCTPLECLQNIDKVVIWGHKLHTHTHSYVHNGFYLAFKYLGYPTYWYDDHDDVSQIDFANALFLTEGQVDGKIPLRNDCLYILHNCNMDKYQAIKAQNRVILQVYTDDLLNLPGLLKKEPCIYYDLSEGYLYTPWATDLLPHEIEAIKETIVLGSNKKAVCWIGTISGGEFGNIHQIAPFRTACKQNGIDFIQKMGMSREENIKLIQSSYMAPTIVGHWQKSKGYIPCRIFKNISYGKMGITNSPRIYELFERKIVYNPNTYRLFYDAKKRMETFTLTDLFEQMDFVKNNHTYLNRIETLLDFFNLWNHSEIRTSLKSYSKNGNQVVPTWL